MGASHSSVENLVYLRAWTATEVEAAQETWRRQKTTMVVDRQAFDDVVGRRNPEVMRVFDCLDADGDGQVDTFEVLLTLTLWCCGSWEEKLGLLFRCFDFNCKGGLRFPELALMASVASRVVARFAEMPEGLQFGQLKETVAAAFGTSPSAELQEDAFTAWFEASSAAKQLREFVDRALAHEAPEAVQTLVRERLHMLEYKASELTEETRKITEAAEALRGETSSCVELWRSLDRLFERLRTASEALRGELAELTQAMENEATDGAGGAAALLAPEARQRHGRLAADVAALERRSAEYLLEAKRLLGQIVEAARGAHDGRPETPVPLPPLPAPPPVGATGADPGADARRLRILDRELRRRQMVLPVASAPQQPKGDAVRPLFSVSLLERHATPVASSVATSGQMLSSRAGSQDLTGAAVAQGSRQATPHEEAAPAQPQSEQPQPEQPPEAERQPAPTTGAPEAGEPAADSAPAAAEEAASEQKIVVAFAAFDPPESVDTPNLMRLEVGDEIVALFQDQGQGWWWGRKSDGTEGWFPPTYVDAKR